MKYIFLIACLFCCSLFAGSLRLYNDSAYKLRAVIRGSDGSYLGEMLINPQQNMNWNDWDTGVMYYNQSVTPYTVTWFCAQSGGDFSVNENVSTGSTVTAMAGNGTKSCKVSKKQPDPNRKSQTEEYLQPQDNQPGNQPQGIGPPGNGAYGPP